VNTEREKFTASSELLSNQRKGVIRGNSPRALTEVSLLWNMVLVSTTPGRVTVCSLRCVRRPQQAIRGNVHCPQWNHENRVRYGTHPSCATGDERYPSLSLVGLLVTDSEQQGPKFIKLKSYRARQATGRHCGLCTGHFSPSSPSGSTVVSTQSMRSVASLRINCNDGSFSTDAENTIAVSAFRIW
jgi:hypothetical protein